MIDLYYSQLANKEDKLTPKRVKAIRNMFGLSQKSFAQFIGINFRTFQSWELGARYPSSPGYALLMVIERYPQIFVKNRQQIIQELKDRSLIM